MVRSSTAVGWYGHIWGRMGDRGTIRDQRLGPVHSRPGNPGTGRASPGPRPPRVHEHHGRGTGAAPRGRDDQDGRTAPAIRVADPGAGPWWNRHHQRHDRHHPRAGPSTGNPATADGPDRAARAARAAAARLLTRDAAVHWLTEITVAGIGQAVAVAITRYRPAAGQHPTWAETLAGT